MGECYTDNDPHDMMERQHAFDTDQGMENHQDSSYHYSDSIYTSNGALVETYTDIHSSSMDPMEDPYNDLDSTSVYYMDPMGDHYYAYLSDDVDYTFDNMQEEMTPITTMFKSDTTKLSGTTFYGSSSRRCTDKTNMSPSYEVPSTSRRHHEKDNAKSAKLPHSTSTPRRRHKKYTDKATLHSSYGAPSPSRRRHDKDIAKSAMLRHALSPPRRRHDKQNAKSAQLQHSPSPSRRRHDKHNAKSAQLRDSPSPSRRRHDKDNAKSTQRLHSPLPSILSRRHKRDATVDHNMSKLQDDIDTLAKLRNMSPSSSGSSKTRSPRHPNDFRRHPSTQER